MNWFFTAWTLYCPKEQSSTMEVTRVLPEFSELKWELVTYDENGNEDTREEVTEIEHGLTATLSARVENMEDGENVHCYVYEEDYAEGDAPVTRRLLEITDGMVTMDWAVKASRQRLQELTEEDELKFVFALEALEGIRSENSGSISPSFKTSIEVRIDKENHKENDKFILQSTDSSYSTEKKIVDDNIENGSIINLEFEDILPGKIYTLKYLPENENDEMIYLQDVPFHYLINGD